MSALPAVPRRRGATQRMPQRQTRRASRAWSCASRKSHRRGKTAARSASTAGLARPWEPHGASSALCAHRWATSNPRPSLCSTQRGSRRRARAARPMCGSAGAPATSRPPATEARSRRGGTKISGRRRWPARSNGGFSISCVCWRCRQSRGRTSKPRAAKRSRCRTSTAAGLMSRRWGGDRSCSGSTESSTSRPATGRAPGRTAIRDPPPNLHGIPPA
mmetsp:Transcript_8482/g.24377  ORF Transcript_8482/g.24377 Transcript_8482/m.24377 type:complete len:218 (-) Transcript_8482:477-1130(-)